MCINFTDNTNKFNLWMNFCIKIGLLGRVQRRLAEEVFGFRRAVFVGILCGGAAVDTRRGGVVNRLIRCGGFVKQLQGRSGSYGMDAG